MREGVIKYFGEQSERHGGKLHWFRDQSFPIRCETIPLLYRKELENALIFVGDYHHAIFDLSNKEDSEYYSWVNDRVQNGWFVLNYIDRRWDEKLMTMRIYMEWTQVYQQLNISTHFDSETFS